MKTVKVWEARDNGDLAPSGVGKQKKTESQRQEQPQGRIWGRIGLDYTRG